MSNEENPRKSQVQIGRDPKADKTWEIEQTIEILEAQTENLELQLRYKIHELEEIEQLGYTNQELCAAINSKQLTFEQAEELARKFLVTEKPLKEALFELLYAISNVSIELNRLA